MPVVTKFHCPDIDQLLAITDSNTALREWAKMVKADPRRCQELGNNDILEYPLWDALRNAIIERSMDKFFYINAPAFADLDFSEESFSDESEAFWLEFVPRTDQMDSHFSLRLVKRSKV